METKGKVIGKAADVRRYEDVEAFFRFVDERIALDVGGSDAGGSGAGQNDSGQNDAGQNDKGQKLGALSILVNNAGVGVFRSVAEMTPAEWQRVIETNLTGAFYCAHEALVRFRNRGGGYLINISSLAGTNAFSGGAAYNASKFGMNGFSEAAMLDHRYENVRVSYVMPGSVSTEFSPGAKPAEWKIAPEDIGDIVLMLLRMPERTLVSRVEVRPSKPRK
jgi:NAD(P)-dependent dehydrogenase (short-subunit alcohol dehydrogenase family)